MRGLIGTTGGGGGCVCSGGEGTGVTNPVAADTLEANVRSAG